MVGSYDSRWDGDQTRPSAERFLGREQSFAHLVESFPRGMESFPGREQKFARSVESFPRGMESFPVLEQNFPVHQ